MRDSCYYDEIDLKIDLERALESIPERNRNILLARLDGHSVSSIAKNYGISTSTVDRITKSAYRIIYYKMT